MDHDSGERGSNRSRFLFFSQFDQSFVDPAPGIRVRDCAEAYPFFFYEIDRVDWSLCCGCPFLISKNVSRGGAHHFTPSSNNKVLVWLWHDDSLYTYWQTYIGDCRRKRQAKQVSCLPNLPIRWVSWPFEARNSQMRGLRDDNLTNDGERLHSGPRSLGRYRRRRTERIQHTGPATGLSRTQAWAQLDRSRWPANSRSGPLWP